MGSPDEVVAIVDKDNNVVGAVTRQRMRDRHLPHRATYILVFNSHGELFVQKRTTTKDVSPGFYDPAAGGVVLDGETYEQGACRELEEEMGIRDVPLASLFDFYFHDESVSVWGRCFSCVYDGQITLQAEEVENGAFLPISEILDRVEREPFAPDSLYALGYYLSQEIKR